MKIIFGNKFIYFLLTAIIFFLIVTTINLFSSSDFTEGGVYYLLLFPGILLIFYPTAFGIQNDEDMRMLENLFAIPNYRFKVWLPRLGMIYVLVSLLLALLAGLSAFALTPAPVFEMVYQLMFPIFFLGSLAFAVSTAVRNGNGTAVIMVIIGLIFWVSGGILEGSKWNIFLNPFSLPRDMNETIWESVITTNRLYLFSATILSLLYGLLNLQKREKFI
ncbi:MAG: hypothetical protein GXO87_11240 [Chlorobi bacterium]|nr:hypothetical protein [Chlorobiota bacterium]